MRYKCVTLWHKTDKNSYKRILFEHAYVINTKKDNIRACEQSENNSMRIRLFCISKCDINVGDFVCVGYNISDVPPRDAFIITELRENFDVSLRLRHYKLDCI